MQASLLVSTERVSVNSPHPPPPAVVHRKSSLTRGFTGIYIPAARYDMWHARVRNLCVNPSVPVELPTPLASV